MAGNLEKPLMSLYGTEWREHGYGLRNLVKLVKNQLCPSTSLSRLRAQEWREREGKYKIGTKGGGGREDGGKKEVQKVYDIQGESQVKDWP